MKTFQMKHGALLFALSLLATLPVASGCRQKMADQPYYRPLDESEFFTDKRSARPLENGVIHRGQYLDRDPIATGLTPEEWELSDKVSIPPKVEPGKEAATLTREQRLADAVGAPRYDQRKDGRKVYVEKFPFEITQQDLQRGQNRYTVYCAVCHGPLGNGQGKIWERGYLQPTSFHTSKVDERTEATTEPDNVRGRSRGYAIWGIDIPMKDVPVGYYFEVITKGYGGMPSYSAQVTPEDRWRIIAYIRTLQNSQGSEAGGKK